ncbi:MULTISPECIES: DUF1489 family protein [Sphingomonas]|uniref:DUF1489 domain-containing protein n=2 Tax=Sphingomonas TaxID=13687 RepID=A0A7W9BUN7_9SPHN|nr:DUF1489 domain-containing protein [Sphingomonas prati]MBB5730239.1 hypothetical protein [Sphingomonas prati]GGE92612.1 hypothetical protein GCM10011404_26920 [Sphingomonas prati]
MHALNITKVAVGCEDVEALAERTRNRTADGEAPIQTRYRPTRHGELIGGSLFWIIKHQLVVRQRIIGFDETPEGRCLIRLDPVLVTVRARPKRAHQGWRYLTADDAPDDLDGGSNEGAAMPAALIRELAELSLL